MKFRRVLILSGILFFAAIGFLYNHGMSHDEQPSTLQTITPFAIFRPYCNGDA